MQFKSFMEALKGKQHKIDKNKNGEIDAHDFKLLRKEESEETIEESEERQARADYKTSPSGRKSHKQVVFGDAESKDDDDKKDMKEAKMSDADMVERERIVKGMKKNISGFKARYGSDAKSVMYATATKQAMKEETVDEAIKKTATGLIHTKDDYENNPSTFKDKEKNKLGSSTERSRMNKAIPPNDDLEEAMNKADVPTYLRKKMGEKPLTMADVKAAPKDSISHPDNLAKARGAVKEEMHHKVGDSVTVKSKFFGVQKGKVTKIDNQSIHVQRSGKTASEKYPHDAVMKEEINLNEVSKSDVDHHFNSWTNSEHAPYNSDAGDDRKVHQSALNYLRGTKVPKDQHEKMAMHIAHKYHGSGIDEQAEEIDEKSDQAKRNKTMKNMMDASRGARFKLNNPVPDAEPEHKTARAHNVAIGRAIRQMQMRNEELKNETFEFHLAEGSYVDLHKKFGNTHKIEYHSHVLYPKHTVTKFDNEKEAESHAKKTGGTVRMSVSPKMRNEEQKPPFDGPYTKVKSNVKDKSGAIHTPMSRAKDLARAAMKKQMKEDIDRLFEAKDEQEYGYEGDMAMNQLATLTRCAEMIKDILKPDTDLPEWVQSKITLATDYIVTAADYLHSELEEQAPVAPVPDKKYIKGTPENKAYMATKKTKVGYPTSVKEEVELDEVERKTLSYGDFVANLLEYESKGGKFVNKGTYGGSYVDPEGADDADDKKPKQQSAEKRGRGRPAGAKSGAGKITGTSKLYK